MAVDLLRAELNGSCHGARSGDELTLDFEFRCEMEPDGRALHLLVEPCEAMALSLNGIDLALTGEWTLTPEYQSIDLSGLVERGINRLKIRFAALKDAPIEFPILAGDFAVRLDPQGEGMLVDEPETLQDGSWTDQGYPFYAGRMRYRQEVLPTFEERKRYFIALQRPAGFTFDIRVAEQSFTSIPFAPWRYEITRLAHTGRSNTLEIEVCASTFNLFGPVHIEERARKEGLGSELFDRIPHENKKLWSRRPVLAPMGLIGGAILEIFDPSVPPPPLKRERKKDDEEAQGEETALENSSE